MGTPYTERSRTGMIGNFSGEYGLKGKREKQSDMPQKIFKDIPWASILLNRNGSPKKVNFYEPLIIIVKDMGSGYS
jgi:hypothetical protein